MPWGGPGDVLDPAQHPPADDDAAEKAETERGGQRPAQRLDDDAPQVGPLMGVAADEQPVAAAQREELGADIA